jgi:hypothetical protein
MVLAVYVWLIVELLLRQGWEGMKKEGVAFLFSFSMIFILSGLLYLPIFLKAGFSPLGFEKSIIVEYRAAGGLGEHLKELFLRVFRNMPNFFSLLFPSGAHVWRSGGWLRLLFFIQKFLGKKRRFLSFFVAHRWQP